MVTTPAQTAPQEVTPTLAEALAFFESASPMKTERVGSEIEFQDAIERHKAEGRRLACVSDAGLPHGHYRLTFLPLSAFRSHDEVSTDERIDGPITWKGDQPFCSLTPNRA